MEHLEHRQLLAAATLDGNIPTVGATQELNITVDLIGASAPQSAVIGLAVTPVAGSSLNPSAPRVQTAEGAGVASLFSTDDAAHDSGLALLAVGQGDYRVVVGGQGAGGGTGKFRVEAFLAGDALNQNGRVDRQEHLQATAAATQKLGSINHVTRLFYRQMGIDVSRNLYHVRLDANQNGAVDHFDLAQIEKNRSAGLVTFQLTGDQGPPIIALGLANDTGRDNADRITTDPAISGTITDDSTISSFLIGIDTAPSFDLLNFLGGIDASGKFTLTAGNLASINGGPLAEGPHTIRLHAADELGNATATPAELTFTLLVDNQAPVVRTIVDRSIQEDSPLKFDLSEVASDPDEGDSVEITVSGPGGVSLPSWLVFSRPDLVLQGTPTNDDVGQVAVQVTATDTQGLSTTRQFVITVENVNDPPTGSAIPNQTVDEDSPFQFDTSAFFRDVDQGDSLSFSATLGGGGQLPPWLSFSAATGILSGMPSGENLGTISVLVTATDRQSQSASQVFTLTVADINDPPVLVEEIEDQRAVQDQPFRLDVSPFFADQDPGDSLTFAATLADGMPLPLWLRINATTGVLSGTPRNDDVAELTVEISATDRLSARVSDTMVVFVNNVNDPPTVDPIPEQTVNEDTEFVIDVGRFFHDIDVNDDLVFVSALVNGAPLPAWIELDQEDGLLSGLATNDDVGTISIHVTAIDAGLVSVSATFNVRVENVNDAPSVFGQISDQGVNQNESFTLDTSAFFQDVDAGDELTFSATLATGQPLPGWLAIDRGTGVLSGTPANDDVGTLDIALTATDTSTQSATTGLVLTVNNVNDAPVIADQTFRLSPDSGPGTLVGTVLANDPDVGDVLSFAILAGDPTGVFSIDAESGQVLLADASQLVNGQTFTLSVEVTDSGDPALRATATLTIRVAENSPPTASPIPDQQAVEDQTFSFNVSAFFSDLDPDDTLTFTASLDNQAPLPSWLSFTSATGLLRGTPGDADVGTLIVRLTAGDTSQAQATGTLRINVVNINDPPQLAAPIPDQSADEDTLFTFEAAGFFVDPDLGDVLTFTATQANGAPLPAWLSLESGGRFRGTPQNSDVGSLSVQLTATDSAGADASATFDLAVRNINDIPAAANDNNFSTRSSTALTISVDSLLANDLDVDVGDVLLISGVSPTSNRGASVALADNQILYDPTPSATLNAIPAGEQLLDTFQYTVRDPHGATNTATVSVTVFGGQQAIEFRLETTDLDGEPTSRIMTGQGFFLRVYVSDLRDNPSGVFSPYLDVTYNASLVEVDGDIVFDPSFTFPDTAPGKLDTPGLINEIGAIAGLTPTGGGEFLVFSLQFVAGDAAGTVIFAGDAADESPLHDVLFFSPPEPVLTSLIDYGSTSLEIASTPVAALSVQAAVPRSALSFAALGPSAPSSLSSSTMEGQTEGVVDEAYAQLGQDGGVQTASFGSESLGQLGETLVEPALSEIAEQSAADTTFPWV